MNAEKIERIRELVEDPEIQAYYAQMKHRLMPDGHFEFGCSYWTDVFAVASACLAVEEAFAARWDQGFWGPLSG